FARLAQDLCDRRGCGVLVLCGPGERDLARQIATLTNRPGVHNLADHPLSLGLTKACVRRSDLLITTASGPPHFAAASGPPPVTPRYRELLARLGLRAPDDFLALPGVIYCGHPDRHVARVALGATPAFLKREHRVRWKDRLASAWAGFGFVPRAYREYRLLHD